jgi:hypothetical protein
VAGTPNWSGNCLTSWIPLGLATGYERQILERPAACAHLAS